MCSRCIDRKETNQHIFQCHSSNASQQHKRSINTFRAKLRKINTAPVLIETFTSILQSNRKGYDIKPTFSRSTNQELKKLVLEILEGQFKIGAHEFVKGYIYHQWDVVQNLYLQQSDINSEQIIWAAGILRATWNYSKSMWQARNDFVHGKESDFLGIVCFINTYEYTNYLHP